MTRELLTVGPLARALLATVMSTALAALSYQLLETPIRRAQVPRRMRWPVPVAAATASVLVAAWVVPPILQSDQKPRLRVASLEFRSHTTGPPEHRVRVPHLDFAALRNDAGPDGSCGPENVDDCIVVHGHGLHVALVGDSHGRMFAPAFIKLAKEHDFTLSINVFAGCPWQADVENLQRPEAERARCDAARAGWYRDVLPVLDPDVVVLANGSRDDPKMWGDLLKRKGGSQESLGQLTLATTNETLDTIVATGARALIIDNTLTTGYGDPLECLARATYVDECRVAVPLKSPRSDAFYETAAARSDLVYTVDLNPVICPTHPWCDPVLDGVSVWKNANHLSTRISVARSGRIWHRLLKSGAFDGLPTRD